MHLINWNNFYEKCHQQPLTTYGFWRAYRMYRSYISKSLDFFLNRTKSSIKVQKVSSCRQKSNQNHILPFWCSINGMEKLNYLCMLTRILYTHMYDARSFCLFLHLNLKINMLSTSSSSSNFSMLNSSG